MSSEGDLPDEGIYRHKVRVNDSIYSLMIFAPAVTRIETGHSGFGMMASGQDESGTTKKKARTIFWLTAANFILQIGLISLMWLYGNHDALQDQLITRNASLAAQQELQGYRQFGESRRSASFLSEAARLVVPAEPENIVCTLQRGQYRCAPTSIGFTSQWDSLDKNSDGVWDIDEAIGSDGEPSHYFDSRRKLYFDSIINSLHDRSQWLRQYNKTFYLSQEILTSRGIPKAYFDYWTGDAQFCSNFDSETCKYIVASGLFESALSKGRIAAEHKGIFDYHSAADYCTTMLKPRGSCEKSLPPSYVRALWKRRSVCGELTVKSAGVIQNPHKPTEVLQVMHPEYANLDVQTSSIDALFTVFMIFILVLFYATNVPEIKCIIKNFDLLAHFPIAEMESNGGSNEDGKYVIKAFSRRHHGALIITALLRLVVLILLLGFGTWFCLSQTSYTELVLNAVALVFITEIDEIFCRIFLDSFDKKQIGMHDCEPLVYYGRVPHGDSTWLGWFYSNHCWGLFLVPLVATVVVLHWQATIRSPIIEALRCACLQEGPNCAESLDNQGAWWSHYWAHTLPAAIHKIEAMRLQGM